MTIARATRSWLLAFVAASAAAIATQTYAQQSPGQPRSEPQTTGQQNPARDAAIHKCIQQAHREVPPELGGSSNIDQQRTLVYSSCMTAAGFAP